ncbi:MAG TPA: hypothetical protein VFV38_03860 [Ktedonobacteraceae bacterium]|nr:hypothetical protein [Ktedonobacteraceae bacterium]
MSEKEHDTLLDDLEVEFSDLDPPTRSRGPAVLRRPRLTARQQKLSLAFTAALFILVLSLLLGSASDVRGLLAQTLFQSRPTNNLTFYVRSNPSWGQFTLDGQALPHPPMPGRDAPLTLAPGTHQITWHAAPFTIQTCALHVPNASTVNSSCFLNNKIRADFVQDVQAVVISFFASLDDLPSNQQATLARRLQAVFSNSGGSETVQPGELYAISLQQNSGRPLSCQFLTHIFNCFNQTNQPLRATLSLQPDTNTSPDDPCARAAQCYFNHQDCRQLCENFLASEGPGWHVQTVVRLLWSYTTLTGQVIAQDQPDSALNNLNKEYQLVSLHIDWHNQSWQIEPVLNTGTDFDNPLCTQATQDTMSLLSTSSLHNHSMSLQQSSELQDNMASGCLVAAMPAPLVIRDPRTPGPNIPPPAYFLARFGVVLAVNDIAQQFLPNLPRADAYEKALAQQLSLSLPPSA